MQTWRGRPSEYRMPPRCGNYCAATIWFICPGRGRCSPPRASIPSLLDDHVSGVEGSIGAIPRRLMVADECSTGRSGPRARSAAPLARVLDDLTADRLLGGRLRFSQPARGYRVAIDPCCWRRRCRRRGRSASWMRVPAPARPALCLAVRVRVPGGRAGAAALPAADRALNVAQNGLDERVEMLVGDLVRPPPRFAWGSFDHVMTNPPHLVAQAARAPPRAARAIAHVEGAVELGGWLPAACAC